ncbi:MAG: hypothetical protein CSA66_05660 [Proteobacteria bacterium]|nr:MAG: hypothetical protein CSA66_05660 [Pseudomonadota bacterium]
MPRHFHLLLRSCEGDTSTALPVLQRRYTVRFIRRRGGEGGIFGGDRAIFEGRFRSPRRRRERHLHVPRPTST